jgi:hypothetical protein
MWGQYDAIGHHNAFRFPVADARVRLFAHHPNREWANRFPSRPVWVVRWWRESTPCLWPATLEMNENYVNRTLLSRPSSPPSTHSLPRRVFLHNIRSFPFSSLDAIRFVPSALCREDQRDPKAAARVFVFFSFGCWGFRPCCF